MPPDLASNSPSRKARATLAFCMQHAVHALLDRALAVEVDDLDLVEGAVGAVDAGDALGQGST